MSVRPQGGSPRRSLSWLSIAAICGGLTLIWLYFAYPFLAHSAGVIIPLMYVGTGCVLIAWGLRSLSVEAFAWLRRVQNQAAHQYRVRMPREAVIYGLILLVLCAGALLGGSNMLMLVFGLMAGPFVLNGQVTLGILRRLTVSRSLPPHATVGESFRVGVTLANRKWVLSSWMVAVEDVVHGPRDVLHPIALFACVPASSQREAFYEVCAARRGACDFGPMRVISRFPLGLMERSIEMGKVERMIVYPRIGRMLPHWRESVETGETVSDAASAGIGASQDEFHSLREYRGGDNPRSIHWRTTARRNELTVREYQHHLRHDLLLAVELWLPGLPRPADLERVELAVSFAASICVDQLLHTADSSVDLVVAGRELFSGSGWMGAAALGEVLERLSLAEGGAAVGLTAEARDVASRGSHGVRKILITSRPGWGDGGERRIWGDPRRVLGEEQFEIFEAEPENVLRFLELDEPAPGATI